jgi:ParB/RepB/Spo0J family partition protein
MPLKLIQKAIDVQVDEIEQSGQKWRASTGDRALEELAESIKANGQIHNISLLTNGSGKKEVINGHRRAASAKHYGIPVLRADVYEFDPVEGEDLDLAIARHLYAANMAEPLLPLERARMFDDIMRETGFDVDQVADLFENESAESIQQVLNLLSIDEQALSIIENNPDRFTETHLRIMAEYASPTKHAWRMKPEEQVRMAGEIAQQTDKLAVKDPRKFEKNVRAVVTERRNREKVKKQDEKKRRQQSDPVKSLFRALEKVDSAVTELLELELAAIKGIEPADKGFVLNRAYTCAEQLGTFADDRLTKLPASVRKAEEAAA